MVIDPLGFVYLPTFALIMPALDCRENPNKIIHHTVPDIGAHGGATNRKVAGSIPDGVRICY
jgi:hypothetical protein